MRAQPVPLERVRVTGGPLKHAQELTAAYLLSLEPDRMMAFYRDARGSRAKGGAVRRLGRRGDETSPGISPVITCPP